MTVEVQSFEMDDFKLHQLASIYEDEDTGWVVTGEDMDEVWNETIHLFNEVRGTDMEVVHDSVRWLYVGVVVT